VELSDRAETPLPSTTPLIVIIIIIIKTLPGPLLGSQHQASHLASKHRSLGWETKLGLMICRGAMRIP
jgi:hypothetical protein